MMTMMKLGWRPGRAAPGVRRQWQRLKSGNNHYGSLAFTFTFASCSWRLATDRGSLSLSSSSDPFSLLSICVSVIPNSPTHSLSLLFFCVVVFVVVVVVVVVHLFYSFDLFSFNS